MNHCRWTQNTKIKSKQTNGVTCTHFLTILAFWKLTFLKFFHNPSLGGRPDRLSGICFYSPVISTGLLAICPKNIWCAECAVYSLCKVSIYLSTTQWLKKNLKYCCHKMYLFIWMRLITWKFLDFCSAALFYFIFVFWSLP